MKSLHAGVSPLLGPVRVPRPLLDQIEVHRKYLGLTRSNYIRRALVLSLTEFCEEAADLAVPVPGDGA